MFVLIDSETMEPYEEPRFLENGDHIMIIPMFQSIEDLKLFAKDIPDGTTGYMTSMVYEDVSELEENLAIPQPDLTT